MTVSDHIVARHAIVTDRLSLRPSSASDAERAFDIRSNWQVTRMLTMAAFPPDRQDMAKWFAGHPDEWRSGRAYRFAIEREGRMIGLVDIDGITGESGTLGYWLERQAWGHGYAFEAAAAAVQFAFGTVGLMRLGAGHAADNPASGRVLDKLGFRPIDMVERFSTPRGQTILQQRYQLPRPSGQTGEMERAGRFRPPWP